MQAMSRVGLYGRVTFAWVGVNGASGACYVVYRPMGGMQLQHDCGMDLKCAAAQGVVSGCWCVGEKQWVWWRVDVWAQVLIFWLGRNELHGSVPRSPVPCRIRVEVPGDFGDWIGWD